MYLKGFFNTCLLLDFFFIIYFNLTFYDLFNYYLFNKLTSPLQFLHKPVWETLKLCNV